MLIPFNKRLLELIKFSGKSLTAFGKELESTTAENIRKLSKNDNANPSIDIVSEISLKYPQVSVEWLLTGKGNMLRGKAQQQSETCPQCKEKTDLILTLRNYIAAQEKTINAKDELLDALKDKLDNCDCNTPKKETG
jgi:hypothetical protein